jgi:hypothetical protein
MTSPQAREAFDLSKEPEAVRERYGMNRFGQCCLLARRLVENGVRFVTINTFLTVFDEITWDIHGSKPFTSIEGMKNIVCPMYDQGYSALIADLHDRSLLDDTLVAAVRLGALVALLHDVIITIGVFSFLGREFSLVMVGAILTIAGYSINDTIVVFDRIREGLRAGRRGSIADIMNACINETLGRTILTSGTTLLATGALFFLGGPVLADFALAIIIGIVVGTYSSIFVAAPVVLWWSKRTGRSIKREVLGDPEAAAV